MSLAEFKDLCIDAVDPVKLGHFWSGALGLQLHHQDNGDAYLTGPTPAHTVWVNRVPESKTVKHRAHLDIYATNVAALESLGAAVHGADNDRWTVMTDPEDGEFCLFARADPPGYRLYELAIDCVDPKALSRWWASVIGGQVVDDDRGFSSIAHIPNVPFEAMTFSEVPEPKTVKNRIHIDVVARNVAALTDAGAALLRVPGDGVRWTVLADPEGNEFCAFVPD